VAVTAGEGNWQPQIVHRPRRSDDGWSEAIVTSAADDLANLRDRGHQDGWRTVTRPVQG